MAIVKQTTTVIRNNSNNTRLNNSIKVSHTLMNNTMKIFCGSCETLEDAKLLMEKANELNNAVGNNMAVGCFFSDKPLTNEQIAQIVKQQGGMRIAMKKMRGRMIPMNNLIEE